MPELSSYPWANLQVTQGLCLLSHHSGSAVLAWMHGNVSTCPLSHPSLHSQGQVSKNSSFFLSHTSSFIFLSANSSKKSMSILPNFKMHKTFIHPVAPLAVTFVSHFPVKQNITASNFPPVVCQIYYIHNFTENSSRNIHLPSQTTCSPGWLAIVLLPGFSHLQTINLEESRIQPPNSSLYLHLSWWSYLDALFHTKHQFHTKQHPHMYLWTGPLAQRCRIRRGVVYSTFLLGYYFQCQT